MVSAPHLGAVSTRSGSTMLARLAPHDKPDLRSGSERHRRAAIGLHCRCCHSGPKSARIYVHLPVGPERRSLHGHKVCRSALIPSTKISSLPNPVMS
jgi:hypothetical protein